MTAYGVCHKCDAWTGSDPYGGKPAPFSDPPRWVHPGRYDVSTKKWECYDCGWSPQRQREAGRPGPRAPGESRQEWRRRQRGAAQ